MTIRFGYADTWQNPSAVGRVPDAPELECCGEFRDDYCNGCTGYEECKREYNEMMEGEPNDNT